MDNLETLIQQRIKQAEDRQISSKVRMIARELGQGKEERDGYDSSSEYTYSDKSLVIYHMFAAGEGGCASETRVIYEGKTVFRDYSRIETYLPGSWEQSIDSLYKTAQAARAQKQFEAQRAEDVAKEEKRQERASNFGFSS